MIDWMNCQRGHWTHILYPRKWNDGRYTVSLKCNHDYGKKVNINFALCPEKSVRIYLLIDGCTCSNILTTIHFLRLHPWWVWTTSLRLEYNLLTAGNEMSFQSTFRFCLIRTTWWKVVIRRWQSKALQLLKR